MGILAAREAEEDGEEAKEVEEVREEEEEVGEEAEEDGEDEEVVAPHDADEDDEEAKFSPTGGRSDGDMAALRERISAGGVGGYKIRFEALPADSFDYEQSFEAGEDKREDGEGDGEEAEEEEEEVDGEEVEEEEEDVDGEVDGEEVEEEEEEVDGEVDGEEAEEEDDGEEAEVRVVNKLSQKYFRDRLVEHFNIMFRRGELRWPKRRGTTAPSILTR